MKYARNIETVVEGITVVGDEAKVAQGLYDILKRTGGKSCAVERKG